MTPLHLEARDLALDYRTLGGRVRALDGASLVLGGSAALGIVGESGSGKTTLGMAIGRLLPTSAARDSGDLMIDGVSVFALSKPDLRRLRRDRLGFVFQNPMASLDPTMRVGRQLQRAHGRRLAAAQIGDALARVGLADVERVARLYPHQLSGGMGQRVVIALAIARGPGLLVADEPTSSLDATVREEVLSLLIGLRHTLGMQIVLLSHELRVVAAHCDAVAVMYAGRVAEHGPARLLFEQPRHPYTAALLRAAPGRERPGQRIAPIAGNPPVLTAPAIGCAFAPRCPLASAECRTERPVPRAFQGRIVLCHHAEQVAR